MPKIPQKKVIAFGFESFRSFDETVTILDRFWHDRTDAIATGGKFVKRFETNSIAKNMSEIRKRPQVIRDLIDIATYIAENNLDRVP